MSAVLERVSCDGEYYLCGQTKAKVGGWAMAFQHQGSFYYCCDSCNTQTRREGLLKTFQHNTAQTLWSTAKLTKKVTKDLMISMHSITSLFWFKNNPMSNSATSAGSGHQRWCPSKQLSFALRDSSCACHLSLVFQSHALHLHLLLVWLQLDVYQCIQIFHYATINSSK